MEENGGLNQFLFFLFKNYLSSFNMEISIASLQGKRSSNEDNESVFINLEGQDKSKRKINIFGVYDGHGGKLISKVASQELPKYFMVNDPKLFIDSNYTTSYITKVFINFMEKINKEHPRASHYSGSTCCMAIIVNDRKSNLLWIINLGDSRAILINKHNEIKALSVDHKPNLPSERERIEKLGGKSKIYYDGSDWRVVDLSLSRALGDMNAHPYVSHLPQLYRYRLHPEDKFLILACDGLWDVMSNKSVGNYVLNNLDKIPYNKLAKELSQEAINQGSSDNVSAVLIKLKN